MVLRYTTQAALRSRDVYCQPSKHTCSIGKMVLYFRTRRPFHFVSHIVIVDRVNLIFYNICYTKPRFKCDYFAR